MQLVNKEFECKICKQQAREKLSSAPTPASIAPLTLEATIRLDARDVQWTIISGLCLNCNQRIELFNGLKSEGQFFSGKSLKALIKNLNKDMTFGAWGVSKRIQLKSLVGVIPDDDLQAFSQAVDRCHNTLPTEY